MSKQTVQMQKQPDNTIYLGNTTPTLQYDNKIFENQYTKTKPNAQLSVTERKSTDVQYVAKNDFLKALDEVSVPKSSYDSSVQQQLTQSLDHDSNAPKNVVAEDVFYDILKYYNMLETPLNPTIVISDIQIRSIIEQFFFFCQNISTQLQAAKMASEIGSDCQITIPHLPPITLTQFSEKYNKPNVILLIFTYSYQQVLIKNVNIQYLTTGHNNVILGKSQSQLMENILQDKKLYKKLLSQIIGYLLTRIVYIYNNSKDSFICCFMHLYLSKNFEIMLMFSEFYTVLSNQQNTLSGTQPYTSNNKSYNLQPQDKLAQAVSRSCGIIFDQQMVSIFQYLKDLPPNKWLTSFVNYICDNKDKFNLNASKQEQNKSYVKNTSELKDFPSQITYFLPLLVAQLDKQEQCIVIQKLSYKIAHIISLKGLIGKQFEKICNQSASSSEDVYDFCQQMILECCQEINNDSM